MVKLPYIQTQDRILSQLQTQWISMLNPILSVPLLSGLQLTGIALKSGVNTINHLLSRKQQGWVITDIDASASIYRSAPFNEQTLELTSNAPANVNIWVF